MMTKGANTQRFEEIIHLDPVETHKAFLRYCWWGSLPLFPAIPYLTATLQVQKEKDPSGKGGIREVPLFIQEEILDSKMGEFIEYTLSRKAWMPFSHHRGRISFFPAGPNCTRMLWEINYDLQPWYFLIPPYYLGWPTLDFVIRNFKRHTEANQKKKSGSFLGFLIKAVLALYLVFMVSRAIRLPSKPLHPGKEYLDTIAKIRQDTPELSKYISQTSILIIGGSGFTGSALVQDLQKRGVRKLKVMGRSFPPVVEFPYGPNREDRYPLAGIEYVRGDVTDSKALAEAMKGVDVVIHTAVSYGTPSFGSLRNGDQTEKINVGGMKNIYNAAKESKSVKQIIYTSSADTVFTHQTLINANETHPYIGLGDADSKYAEGKWAIGDHYARTKIMAEKFLLSMDNKDGIRTVSLRPNGIFGPGEFIAFRRAVDSAFILGAIPFYFDKGTNTKNDFSCVYNLAYAHILASYKLATNPDVAGGKAYFITDEEISSVASMHFAKETIEKTAGPVVELLWIPGWIMPKFGYSMEVLEKFLWEKFGIVMPIFLNYKEAMKTVVGHYFDNSRARKDLGYSPVIPFKECQRMTTEEVMRRYGVAK